jgi:hypothetical protein
MNRYHFSLGNSRVGPVGYCAEVDADTKTKPSPLSEVPSKRSTAS